MLSVPTDARVFVEQLRRATAKLRAIMEHWRERQDLDAILGWRVSDLEKVAIAIEQSKTTISDGSDKARELIYAIEEAASDTGINGIEQQVTAATSELHSVWFGLTVDWLSQGADRAGS